MKRVQCEKLLQVQVLGMESVLLVKSGGQMLTVFSQRFWIDDPMLHAQLILDRSKVVLPGKMDVVPCAECLQPWFVVER